MPIGSATIFARGPWPSEDRTASLIDHALSLVENVVVADCKGHYDQAQRYMIISLKGVYYHYCELPAAKFNGLIDAPSMGQFFD
jgi:hypothetical protein